MIWNGTTEELILFINDLNKKHKIKKFDYKISTKQIEFLDRILSKDQQHKIRTTIFCKPTNQQTHLHAQSNHLKSLKGSTLHSQALRIKTICSATSLFNINCEIITKRFKERGYAENMVNKQVDKVKNFKRKQLLLTNKKTIQNRIPVSITYNKQISAEYIENYPKKLEHFANITYSSKVFDKKPMITYKRKKILVNL